MLACYLFLITMLLDCYETFYHYLVCFCETLFNLVGQEQILLR